MFDWIKCCLNFFCLTLIWWTGGRSKFWWAAVLFGTSGESNSDSCKKKNPDPWPSTSANGRVICCCCCCCMYWCCLKYTLSTARTVVGWTCPVWIWWFGGTCANGIEPPAATGTNYEMIEIFTVNFVNFVFFHLPMNEIEWNLLTNGVTHLAEVFWDFAVQNGRFLALIRHAAVAV